MPMAMPPFSFAPLQAASMTPPKPAAHKHCPRLCYLFSDLIGKRPCSVGAPVAVVSNDCYLRPAHMTCLIWAEIIVLED